jgi:hypothetical protein
MQLSGLPDSIGPAASGPSAALELAQPYSLPIRGEFRLQAEAQTGSHDPAINRPDPRVRFTNGESTVPFALPAGSRRVTAQIASTGTVASRVVVKLENVYASGAPVLSLPTARQFLVPRITPVITDACFVAGPASGVVTVRATGYTTTRQISSATFTYGNKSSALDVSGSSSDWFSTDEAVRNGGAFTLEIPFSVEGGSIGSASLSLANSAGSSANRPLQRCQ